MRACFGRAAKRKRRRLLLDLGYLGVLAGAGVAGCFALHRWAPTLVAGTAGGLQSLFAVLATSLAAIVVLLLGSIFLIAQQVSSTFGHRAVNAVLLRPGIRVMFAAALLLAVATLLVSGQLPSSPSAAPNHWITAIAGMLALGSATFIFGAAITLALLSNQATSWESFTAWLVREAAKCRDRPPRRELRILRQGLSMAAHDRDGHRMRRALEAIEAIVDEHLEVRLKHPQRKALRVAAEQTTWSEELSWALLHAGEEALVGGALWVDVDRIGVVFLKLIGDLRSGGLVDEAVVMVDALAQLAAAGQQLDARCALRNLWLPRCATALAIVESSNEANAEHRRLAEHALVGWALACFTVDGYAWPRGALYLDARNCLGDDPPLENLSKLVEEVVDAREPFTRMRRWPATDAGRKKLVDGALAILATL